ncbi:hypothetical protein PsYK624_165190 [Phanerochaete sordida]|uniref:Uncharacterized protein n=1 Tax=Phanerochaete sordida TaxID=48140 RepID=A0A9P3GSF1_9APHY|nr:hypothetical protein PsYK624_165190 [Phanerochaete sordida]
MADWSAPQARRGPYEHHEYRREEIEGRKAGHLTLAKPRQTIEPNAQWVDLGFRRGLYIASGTYAGRRVPLIPTAEGTLPTPWHAFHLRWASDETFYTAFIPEDNPFNDPLLEPLMAHRWKIVPHVTEKPATKKDATPTSLVMYGLPVASVEEWKSLEDMIIRITRIITAWGNLLLPADYTPPPVPSSYGYHRRFATRKIANKVIGFARASFVLWAALLSFQVSRIERDTLPMPLPPDDPRGWRVTIGALEIYPDGRQPAAEAWHRLMEQQGLLPPDVTALLKDSWICDFRRRRVGCFIDLTASRTPKWLDYMRHVMRITYICSTFWFYYGESPKNHLTLHLARALYELTSADGVVQAARARAAGIELAALAKDIIARGDPEQARLARKAIARGDPDVRAQLEAIARGERVPDLDEPERAHLEAHRERDEALPLATDSDAPEPNRNSRQRRGEDIFAFMAREKAHIKARLANESADERERRLAREAEEKAKPYPTRKGPAVYHWVKVRNHWLREWVSSRCYQALWRDTKEIHRIYNSVRHEWDVSLLFDPDNKVHTDDTYEGWDQLVPNLDDDDFADLDEGLDGGTEGNGAAGSDRPDVPRAHRFGREAEKPVVGDGLLRWRPEDQTAHADMAPEALLAVLLARYGVQVELPYTPMHREDGESVLREPTVLRMLAHMTAAGVFNGPELPAICDFVTGITDRTPYPLLSDISTVNERHSGLKSRASVVVVARYGRTYVLSRHRRGWVLAVTSATTALEVVRRGWDPEKDMTAEEMIRRGMEFSTLALSRSPLPTAAPAPAVPKRSESGWSGLGYREPDYRPTPLDFALYERSRRAILGRPHGRAALMRGGIVWRLAYEDVDPQRVLFGPSDSGQKDVQLLGDVAYEDDRLSEEELFVICGVYRIYAVPSRFQGEIGIGQLIVAERIDLA